MSNTVIYLTLQNNFKISSTSHFEKLFFDKSRNERRPTAFTMHAIVGRSFASKLHSTKEIDWSSIEDSLHMMLSQLLNLWKIDSTGCIFNGSEGHSSWLSKFGKLHLLKIIFFKSNKNIISSIFTNSLSVFEKSKSVNSIVLRSFSLHFFKNWKNWIVLQSKLKSSFIFGLICILSYSCVWMLKIKYIKTISLK